MSMLTGKKIVIAGLGLIGGSLAKALSRVAPDCKITGVGRNEAMLQQAIVDGSISAYSTDLQTACDDVDIIVLAAPVLAIEHQLRLIAPVLQEHTIITDVASVKQAVVTAANNVFGSLPAGFVPGHPIAGSERSSYLAANADLFKNRKTIITPLQSSSASACEVVRAMWEMCGAEVVDMTVERHDQVLAATSHLPHLLAFALVDTLSQQGETEEIFRYAAGGFRDFTRIASSDPTMWRDIFLTNGPATIAVLDEYMQDLTRLRQALLDGDGVGLFDTFTRARLARERFLALTGQAAATTEAAVKTPD